MSASSYSGTVGDMGIPRVIVPTSILQTFILQLQQGGTHDSKCLGFRVYKP